MRKTFKYRLYPTKAQEAMLSEQLREACRLYNAALQERRDAYRTHKISLNYYTQANQLKDIRDAGDLALPNYHCAQDVLKRVDKAYQAFFRRIKARQKAGFPRFKSSRRYDSLTFPDEARHNEIYRGHLRIQGVGDIKIRLHRPIDGKIKTTTVKRECDQWYVCFSVEYEAAPLPKVDEAVGIDLGLESFATLFRQPKEGTEDFANGYKIENPRFFRNAQAKFRRVQRRVARRKKGSNRRRKAVLWLAKAHQYVRNQRRDFHHKESRKIVNTYDTIVVEDLNVKGLSRGMLAKSVHDAGWSQFISQIAYKAENADRRLITVDPRGTTQRCICGATNSIELKDRTHACASCGLIRDRDRNSAMEILRLGLSLQTVTKPEVRVCVV